MTWLSAFVSLHATASLVFAQGTDLNPLVIGGQPVTDGAYEHVVALVQDSSIFCTGTLVQPDLVVTAAHCVDPQFPFDRPEDRIKIYVGTGAEGGRVMATHAVRAIHTNPAYRKHFMGMADTAILELVAPVVGVQPARIPDESLLVRQLLRPESRVRLVGFGMRDNDNYRRFGRKYEVDTKVLKSHTNEFSAGEVGKDTCSGDSGGPVFAEINGVEYLVGVTSRGPSRCGEPFMGHYFGGIYGSPYDSVCWIHQASGRLLTSTMPLHCQDVPQRLNDQKSFVELCKTPTDAHVAHLRDVLLSSTSSTSCEALSAHLSAQTELDLTGYYLTDLSLLAGFRNLKIVNLNDNYIHDLSPVMNMNLSRFRAGWNRIPSEQWAQIRSRHPDALVHGERLQHHNFRDTEFSKICKNPANEEQKSSIRTLSSALWIFGAFTCEEANESLLRRGYLDVDAPLLDSSILMGLESASHLNYIDMPNAFAVVQSMTGLEYASQEYGDHPLTSEEVASLTTNGIKYLYEPPKPGYRESIFYRHCQGESLPEKEDELFERICSQMSSCDRFGMRNCIADTHRIMKYTFNLNLKHMELDNIEFLRDFDHLQELDVSHNQIRDLSPLKNLQYLRSLRAVGNPLENPVCPRPETTCEF